MPESAQLNILIETGTDFVLPFTVYDNNGNPLDLTGATVESQLREYAEAYDFFEFACMHNSSGGRITVTMPHETTAQIPFTHGVYDVKVTLADGTISHPLSGEASIKEGVTKSSDGSILFMLGINSFEDLPEVGNVDRLYFVYGDRKIYRWNGTNYVGTAVGNGIQKIELVEHVDTFTDKYRITYDDGGHFDYLVTTRGIDHISLIGSTGTVRTGVIDQYRIYFSDDTTHDYYVTNGRAFDVKTSYDATQAYDYLAMVRVNGATYVAVQDVPANTAISNTDYWLKVISNFSVGTVSTGTAGSDAVVTITGTPDDPMLNFIIPRGTPGNESIDDTAGEGDTDRVWSADKSYKETSLYKNTCVHYDCWYAAKGGTITAYPTRVKTKNFKIPYDCVISFDDLPANTYGSEYKVSYAIRNSDNTEDVERLSTWTLHKNVPPIKVEKGQYVEISTYYEPQIDVSDVATFEPIRQAVNFHLTEVQQNSQIAYNTSSDLDEVFSYDYELTVGYHITPSGTIQEYTNRAISDFIPVIPNESIVFVNNKIAQNTSNAYTITTFQIHFYDRNKAHIGYVNHGNTSYGMKFSEVIPENTYYIRLYLHFGGAQFTEDIVAEVYKCIKVYTIPYLLNHEFRIEYLERMDLLFGNLQDVSIKNGVPHNPTNQQAVQTERIEIKPGDCYELIVPENVNANGYHYVYAIDEIGENDSITRIEYLENNSSPIRAVRTYNAKYAAFSLASKDSSPETSVEHYNALRYTNFTKNFFIRRVNIITEENKLESILSQGIFNYNGENKTLALIHFSDIHSGVNVNRVSEFRKAYKSKIDDTICTGDMLSSRYSNTMDFWIDPEILTCIGNHDTLNVEEGFDWTQVTPQADAYTKFIAPYYSSWGNNVSIVTNHTYYYKDYTDKGFRLIVLDTTIRDSAEIASEVTWFSTVLDDARTNNLAVVIASHFPPYNQVKIDTNFTDKIRVASKGEMSAYGWASSRIQFQNLVSNFMTNGGDFLCWLTGHSHCDFVSYDRDYPNQLFLTVTSAFPQNISSSSARVEGEKSQDAFNVVVFDKTRRLVKLIRVGQDYDMFMRHIGTLTIDISTTPPTVISSN